MENHPIQVSCGTRQLFLDDYCIESMAHLQKTMNKPRKKGAVIRTNPLANESGFQIRSAPYWNEKAALYRLPVSGGRRQTRIWESKDGLHWVPFADSKMYLWTVIYDKFETDPQQCYKALTPSAGGKSGPGGTALSADMVDWRITDIPKIECSDEWNLSFDEKNHLYIATVKRGGPWGRAVYLTTSPDFEHWSEPALIFHTDDQDQILGRINIENRFADDSVKKPFFNIPEKYNADVYNMGLFAYEGLYIGLPAIFHQTGKVPGSWAGFGEYPMSDEMREIYQRDGDWSGFHHIQLTCSRDLLKWERLGNRQPFIDLSPLGAGAYDLETIMPPSSPVVRGDELWFYYTGMQCYGGSFGFDDFDSSAICLAVLRRDGFVSLDSGRQPGELLTRPFRLEGDRLHLNADASAGELSVSAISNSNDLAAVSDPVRVNAADELVTWKTGTFSRLKGQMIQLKFSSVNAKFYSFWVD